MSTLYIRDKDGKFIQLPSIPGKSSYEIAVEKGVFSGTEEEFAQQQVFGNKEILDSITQDQIDFWNSAKGMTEEEKIALSKKFDDVELNEAETNETQTALDFFANGVKIKTVYFSGGGGGSTDAPPYISTIISENNILGVGETFNLQLDFSSSVIGRGTLKVFINDKETISMSIPQGESNIPLEDKYFDKGNNRVTMYVIDRTGVMSNSLTFYVRYGSLEIATDFDPYTAYDYGAVIRYYFTPTAVDTSLTLTMYMSIDGEVKPGVMCTSDTRGYYTFPNNLNVGAHHCQAYIIDSAGNTSNILSFNLIIIDDTSLIVASDTINPSLEEGSQLSLDYKVYMKNNTSFITKTYVDSTLVNTGTCGLEMSYYRTSSLSEGVHTIRLEVYDVTETVSDYILWTVTITPSTYTMLEPVTAGALFIGTAQNMSNSSENKEVWIGKDQDGNTVSAQLNGFAFNSESGWVNDELLITGASSVEVPITPLANNARYGFTLDIEFASKMIGVEDALVLNLWDDEKDCGIKITTEKVIIRSAEGNQSDLYFTDDEMTSVIFVIDRNETTAKIYLNGVMCSAFHLSDYNVDGVPYLEDFTVDGPIILGGSGHARIKNLRVYQIALTTDEILNNFMANEKDKGKQRELVEFQKGEHLPTLTIYCDFSGLGKDDKKPCSITYISTDEEKYGKSFTLSHKKSSLQYQGTSSMAYPIKNYRINLADENGNKLRYEFPFGKPEYRYTLKADFMSSGHWTNTGLTKWINENLYNYNVDDEKSMNPKKWYDINNGGDLDDTRECIYGFPCRLILVNDGNTPLNEGQNEPTPGNTKDMGIFNFNHDKDATDTMGFDDDAFPNCASYEVTANSDTSAGAFMPKMIDTIEIDQAGAYVTGFIYTNEIKSNILKVESDGYIQDLCMYWDSSGTMNYINLRTYTLDLVAKDVAYFKLYFDGDKTQPTYIKINDMEFKTVLVETGPKNVTSFYQKDEAELLDYIKQSFEMRFPDEEDVPEGWGYMGTPVPVIDYWYNPSSETFYTVLIPHPKSSYTVSVDGPSSLRAVGCSNSGDYQQDYIGDGGNSITINTNGSPRVSFGTTELWNNITIDGVVYYPGERLDATTSEEALGEPRMGRMGGLKALIDWVDKCSDEEFVRDFEQHFHKDYTFRYYLLVITLGMVDNLGKNMMLDTWDNKIFMPRFYDCDTICSYDNSGQLKFDVDIEMEQGYWNTSTSRLWTRIRDLFHDELVAKYNNMRQNGLSYESLMRCFYDEQIAKIPQKYYNMDYDVKYAPFADSYLGMANGDTYEHLKRWLKNRLIFVDTLYDYAPSYNNDMLTIRANTTEPMTLYIETYTPVYQHLSWYNGQMDKKKIDGKIAVEFTGTAMAETDQEVLIYGGSNIKAIRGISSMNPNRMLIGSATRLIELDASDCPLLSDINANKSNLAPHVYLNRVDLSGCPLLGGNLIINNSPLIREIDIRGTAITGLNLPSNLRNLKALKLPVAISNLTLNDAGQLHTLEFEPGSKMKTVSMTNCNALTNVVNFDLENVANVTLNNSYNITNELYFSKTTNLSLRNMSNLERVIYLPNAEYETFDKSNIDNASDYKVSVFNSPKCNTFMVTAPYRESYMKDYGEVKPDEVFIANSIDISDTRFTDVKLLATTDTNVLKLPSTTKNIIVDSAYDLDTEYLTDGGYDTIHDELLEPYTTDYEDPAYLVRKMGTLTELEPGYEYVNNMIENPKVNIVNSTDYHLCTLSFGDKKPIQGETYTLCIKGSIGNNATHISVLTNYGNSWLVDLYPARYNASHGVYTNTFTWTPSYNDNISLYLPPQGSTGASIEWVKLEEGDTVTYGVTPNIVPSASDGSLIFAMYAPDNTTEPASGIWDMTGLEIDAFHTFGLNNDIEQLYGIVDKEMKIYGSDLEWESSWGVVNKAIVTLPENSKSFSCLETSPSVVFFNENDVEIGKLVTIQGSTVVEIPPGSKYMVYEMYNSVSDKIEIKITHQQATVTGIIMPNRYDDYAYQVDNLRLPNELLRYTASAENVFPTMRAEAEFQYDSIVTPKDGLYEHIIIAKDPNNLPFSISFGSNGTARDYFITVDYIDTSSCKNMESMFYFCSKLISVNLTGCDTTKVTNMNYMFQGCTSLEHIIGLNTLDTSNVTSMASMFVNCQKLLSLDLSKFDTAKVTSMQNMFNGCNTLTSLDLSNFDTSNVTNMGSMFYNCWRLTTVKGMDSWYCPRLYDISSMFQGVNMLTRIDASSWKRGEEGEAAITACYSFANNTAVTYLDISNLVFIDNVNFANLTQAQLQTLKWTNWTEPINISILTSLTKDCIVDLIANLAVVTDNPTLTIGSTLMGYLTEEQIATATTKGWTIA